MDERTHQQVMDIKQGFRLRMNGMTAASMRDKGTQYKLNWGISLVELRQMAKGLEHSYELAVELWKEDIRECKILATLLMPPEKMLPDLADLWMEQTPTTEMAEMLAFNLFQHVDFAPQKAFEWMASASEIRQICAYHILARLFARGIEPSERSAEEYADQVEAALKDPHAGVRHAAWGSLQKYAMLGEEYGRKADKIAKSADLAIF